MWKKKEIAVLCCDTCKKELDEFPIEVMERACGYAQCAKCVERFGN